MPGRSLVPPAKITEICVNTPNTASLMGLAPFLRMSVAGADLAPIGKSLLARAEQDASDVNAMHDLAIFMHCVGLHELALNLQQQALQQQRNYLLPARRQPASLRVLVLMAAGDLAANMPLDCLLENSDVDLALHYVAPGGLPAADLAEHDVVFIAIGESAANQPLLQLLAQQLANWPKPVINQPGNIPQVARDTASRLLQDIPGLLMPPTLQVPRQTLTALADGQLQPSTLLAGHHFPLIIRPVGSHAGNDLQKIDTPAELQTYLAGSRAEQFYLSAFIDYSSDDGQFRKYRIALLEGVPYASHMAISSHWMVHYVNAGMYEDAAKRQEEAAFMQHFDSFAARHAAALQSINAKTGLEYLCLDCAETRDGKLFVFEIDHAMVVHAMDPVDLFPYKQTYMQKLIDAFRAMLLRHAGRPVTPMAAA